jgi:ABC-type Fe3+-siderophore transport system permease subunit
MIAKTTLGKWAGGLAVLFVVLFTALVRGRGSRYMAIIGIGALISGMAAFVTGLVSLIKFKDRSPAPILAIVFGSFAVFMIIMETVEAIVWRLTH